MNEPWKITLLGGLRAERGQEAAVNRFYTHKYGALLAYLAYFRDRAHTREALAEMFWPDSGEKQGRNSLSQALSSLRHQLEPPGTPASAVLRADRFSISLNPQAVTTDVALFEQEIRAASVSGTKLTAAERREHMARALDLYRGPLLPGYYEDWIAGETERLASLFFETAGRLVAEYEESGDSAAALTVARQAVSADPLREEGQAHLIRLLAATGQPTAALRQYREFERRIDEDTGDEPSPTLQALFRRIEKEAGAAVGTVAPAAIPAAPRLPQPSLPTPGPGGTDTVTFLLTDIEGSTGQWERTQARERAGGETFRSALERHHTILREEFARHGGQEIKEAGDGFLVAFAGAGKALACAVACQGALSREPWPESVGPLLVRMAVHSGDIETNESGEYHGLALHRASRILLAGHGGQILLSEATAVLVRRDISEDIRLMDLGAFRLRDVPTPERLFQVEYSSQGQHEYPPLRAEAGFANHLPLQFTRFFGREKEISTLREMVLDPAICLLTLTGPGGTGKTRLSLAVAERLMEPLKGAIWFAPLADLTDPGLIPGALLDALRIARSPQRDPLDQAVEALSKQPSLLVLDNFEHLIEGGGTETVRSLLSRVPDLTILVTSRQILGLTGEREFALSPLPTPGHGDTLPETLSTFDSVRLFIDRAQAVRPDFQVTAGNAPAIAALCAGLEGIPLALELAAARAQVLSPAQMLAQLDHRFEFLASRKRDVGERQRTLRGAIEWSFRLLSPELQRFFCRLSVFRGGWTSDSAEAVCEEPLALDYLAQLRDCSLVEAQEDSVNGTGDVRFRMLETLREYGEEQTTTEERAAGRRRHADFCQGLARELFPSILYGPEPLPALLRLEAEHDNLRAALTWGLEESDRFDTPVDMCLSLWRFWDVRGRPAEGYAWCGRAVEHALPQEGIMTPAELGRAAELCRQMTYLGRKAGERNRAEELAAHCLRLAAASGDEIVRAWSLWNADRLEEALPIFEAAGHQGGIRVTRGSFAGRALNVCDYAAALQWCGSDMEPFARARIARETGDYETAWDIYRQQREKSRTAGHLINYSLTFAYTGLLALAEGRLEEARQLVQQADNEFSERGQTGYRLLPLLYLTEISWREGDLTGALAQINVMREMFPSRPSSIDALHGRLLLAAGDRDQSYTYLRRCLEIFKKRPLDTAVALEHLAFWWGEGQDVVPAVRLLGVADALRERFGTPRGPVDLADHEALLCRLRETLDESAFTTAWESGRAMSWEQAVAYALGQEVVAE